MKANPGGRIEPDEALGREDLVDQLWTILESQSVYMNAERRIGKTTILNILESSPKKGWSPAKTDLEACHTALDFAKTVYAQIHHFFGTKQKALRRAREFYNQIGGTEIGGVLRLPDSKTGEWKTLLQECFRDLHEAHGETETRILFLWDEVPFMIDNILNREDEKTAMEVLDTLRFARQTFPEIRIIMTGSVGLHHVLAKLKESGYANAPVNDMAAFEVPALSPEAGTRLARMLFEGEKIECKEIDKVSLELTKIVDHFPYYIHHMVRQLKFRGKPVDAEIIKEVLEAQITNPNDPWELKHYRTRLQTYYGMDERNVLAILDVLAMEDSSINFEVLSKKISATTAGLDKERIRLLLTLLERDHYLQRTKEGYSFTFPLIRKWWLMDRSL